MHKAFSNIVTEGFNFTNLSKKEKNLEQLVSGEVVSA